MPKLFCRKKTIDDQERLCNAVQSLNMCKQQCDAVTSKNEKLRAAYIKDIKKLSKLPRPPRHRIRALLMQCKLLDNNLKSIANHTTSIFRHKLTLEQAMLNLTMGESLKETVDALGATNVSVDKIDDMSEALTNMTDAVCEISEALSANQISSFEIDEDELNAELLELCEPELELPVAPTEPLVASASAEDATASVLSSKG